MFNVEEEEASVVGVTEVDKRLEIYRKMKQQLLKDLEANK